MFKKTFTFILVMFVFVLSAIAASALQPGIEITEGQAWGAIIDVEKAGFEAGKTYTLNFTVESFGTTGFKVHYVEDEILVSEYTSGTVAAFPAFFENGTVPDGATITLSVDFVYGETTELDSKYIGFYGLYDGTDFNVLHVSIVESTADRPPPGAVEDVPDKGIPDVGVTGVAVITGVALTAAGIMIITKRKNK